MSLSKMQDDFFIELIADIFNEYSIVENSLGTIYLKHFNQIRTTSNLSRKKIYVEAARKRGLPSEQDALDYLVKEEMWDLEKEQLIQDKTKFLENLKKSTSKILLPSQREKHKELIQFEEKNLRDISLERAELIGLTAEKYAEKKVNRDFFESIAYFDVDFKNPVLHNLEYDNRETERIINEVQDDFFNKFRDANISKAALSNAYSPYLSFSENPYEIYGKPLKDMSSFQLKLSSYGKTFLSIFKNTSKEIPENIAKDPELLIEFAEAQRNDKRTATKKSNENDGGSAIFGASSTDIQAIKTETEDAITLDEALKQSGGSMNMKDLMKMHGV